MASTPHTRDAGARRIWWLTRWALAGAVGLSAAVSLVVAKAQTGGGASRSTGSPTVAPQPVVIGPATGNGGGGGFQPPITPPVQQVGGGNGGGGVATSGGS